MYCFNAKLFFFQLSEPLIFDDNIGSIRCPNNMARINYYCQVAGWGKNGETENVRKF